ncbi:MAG TPA: radical SAM protein [Nitrospira sp.]|nr:radical SAM protein [Nitrospira sp.]
MLSIKEPRHSGIELNLGALLDRHPELQINQEEYNINVTANYGESLTRDEVLEKFAQHDGAGRPAHLYLHVPLCSYICHFCNYVKKALPKNGREEETLEAWVSRLIEESKRYLERFDWIGKARIESIYLGGGTAALMRESQLGRLLAHIHERYNLSHVQEVTLEGNPDNYDRDFVRAIQRLGFNRFSVGVQSFQDRVTAFTGRGHDRLASLKAIKVLLDSGDPFNVDMMFGLPYQTPGTVEEDLRTLVELGVPTITIYRLRNAERHKMGIGNVSVWNVPSVRDKLYKQGLFPSLEETYAMREAAVRVLLEFGYQPSPCGWWSRPGTYPGGNIPHVSANKWQHYHTMLAVGPGAYGWLTGRRGEVIQTHNETDIAAYVRHLESQSTPPLSFGRHLQGHQAVASALGFAFKANQPILFDRFADEYRVDLLREEPYRSVIEDLLEKRLVEVAPTGRSIRPTLEGEALHEEIISVYIHGRIGSFQDAVCKRF